MNTICEVPKRSILLLFAPDAGYKLRGSLLQKKFIKFRDAGCRPKLARSVYFGSRHPVAEVEHMLEKECADIRNGVYHDVIALGSNVNNQYSVLVGIADAAGVRIVNISDTRSTASRLITRWFYYSLDEFQWQCIFEDWKAQAQRA